MVFLQETSIIAFILQITFFIAHVPVIHLKYEMLSKRREGNAPSTPR